MKREDITYNKFNRKNFLKSIKRKLEFFDINCKLLITKLKKESTAHNIKIIELINITIQNPNTFKTNNIFQLLIFIEEYYDFLDQFKKTVQNIKNFDLLKDSHKTYLKKQQDFIEKLKNNIENPKSLDEETVNKILKETN